jgi:hypothetical protein
VYYILAILAVIAFVRIMRSNFRDNLRPFQVVGARIKGEIVNVTILSVNTELQTATVIDSDKNSIEISFNNIFVPSFRD